MAGTLPNITAAQLAHIPAAALASALTGATHLASTIAPAAIPGLTKAQLSDFTATIIYRFHKGQLQQLTSDQVHDIAIG